MSVYVELRGCSCPADVIHRIEAALCQAGLRDDAVRYAAQMREMHPHTPETAALYAPDVVVYRREEAELEARVLAAEGV